ncbi:hypothetical protein [Oceanicaulis sp.]|uniref:hypothetical protein n=1 Tax=Oceanicaulis sp. TaxID=1924941 RepID=UPI003BA88CF8
MIILVQLAHSLIYMLAVLCIIGVWVFALTGRARKLLIVTLGGPILIGLGLLLNNGECVFQSWARTLTDTPEGVWSRDILFLPEAIARNTPWIFTPVFLLGAVLALHRIGRQNRLNA